MSAALELEANPAELPAATDGTELEAPLLSRPKTRGECVDGPRPCPRVSCRHHLYLDVSPETGAIKLNFPGVEVEDMGESCSLDVADRGDHKLEEVGGALGCTRERVRQIEAESLQTVKRRGVSLGILDERRRARRAR